MKNEKLLITIAKADNCAAAEYITLRLESIVPLIVIVDTFDASEKQQVLSFISKAANVLDCVMQTVSNEVFLVASPKNIEVLSNTDETNYEINIRGRRQTG